MALWVPPERVSIPTKMSSFPACGPDSDSQGSLSYCWTTENPHAVFILQRCYHSFHYAPLLAPPHLHAPILLPRWCLLQQGDLCKQKALPWKRHIFLANGMHCCQDALHIRMSCCWDVLLSGYAAHWDMLLCTSNMMCCP